MRVSMTTFVIWGLACNYVFRNNGAMKTVKQFIDALGGTVKVAEALSLPVSTVSGWNISNSVPRWREPALRELAREKGEPFPESFATQAAA